MDPLKEFIYMPVKLASEWLAGKGLHLQIFGQTSLLSGQNFMQSLRALGCRALYHPFGGDIHLFHPADEKNSQQEKSAQLLALFPGPGVEFDNIMKCVHCGLCLDSCPTYRESGLEQDSPRGRLYLMNAVWRGDMTFTEDNVRYLDRCIDCRACETACPSKVPYGELIEKTRGVLKEQFKRPLVPSALQNFFFRLVLPHTGRLKLFSNLFKIYSYTGLRQLITKTALRRVLPGVMVKGQYMLPVFEGASFKQKYAGTHHPAGKNIGVKTTLFTGCVADVSDHEVHLSTLNLLLRAGCEVEVKPNQSCCCALQVHGGDRETGRTLALKNVEVFSDSKAQKIITNAGGCSAQLKEYHLLFTSAESETQNRVRRLKRRLPIFWSF
ncbi:hypothetical protein CHS0354_001959 [Potamilus streckersoni]|uniref:4Fe-4S ferredoxin-type domain-containing protein n=1 Tax=Potamilus streckersoni TaxID=2493646 RepID=A0AAE0T5F0_9BIVA|nr:hypothetical protein CHS0354_001959 [Potamilus streckersoni]